MKTPDSLWKKTGAGRFLEMFPGQLADILSSSGVAARDSLTDVLPHIFWRWYFLQLPAVPETSAYWLADFCREQEKWPEGGQFCPRISGAVANGNLSVKIEMDYIGFLEQPFLADLKRLQAEEPLLYDFDERYRIELDFVSAHWTDAHGPITTDSDGRELALFYLEMCLGIWYEYNHDISSAFEMDEWISFWHLQLRAAGSTPGLGTDDLLDAFVKKMRETIPNYGLNKEELGTLDEVDMTKKRITKQIKQQFYFWGELCHYILMPLSLYWNLLAPLYLDDEVFANDVIEATNTTSPQPEMFNAPCTEICLTPFGRTVIL